MDHLAHMQNLPKMDTVGRSFLMEREIKLKNNQKDQYTTDIN